jgi:hypothetical protein
VSHSNGCRIDAAAQAAGVVRRPGAQVAPADVQTQSESRRPRRSPRQRFLRGLFAGGTLCYQSQQILRQAGLMLFSNAPLSDDGRLSDPAQSVGHTLIDMGDDEHTRGRLHPMIDGTLRAQRILAESVDPEVAILLLDFILGTNAAQDPVGDIVGAIVEGRQRRPKGAGDLTVVASICGTDADPQNLSRQSETLIEAGVHVFWSNARATGFCRERLAIE